MTVALIGLVALGLLLGGGLVFAVRWGMHGWDEANARGDLYQAMTMERDRTATELASEKQRSAAQAVRLAIAERTIKARAEEATAATVKKIKEAKTPQAAADAVNAALPKVIVDHAAPTFKDDKPIEELK